MAVQLKRYYMGRVTHEKSIAAGVYADDDPALLGLAAWLVQRGVAEYVDDALLPATDTKTEAPIETNSPPEVLEFKGRTLVPSLPAAPPGKPSTKTQARPSHGRK